MGIRFIAVGSALAVLLVIIVLATFFLSRRNRLILYITLLLAGVGVWGYIRVQQKYVFSGLALQLYASGFNQPVYALYPPDDTDRFFVVERLGTIHIWQDGQIQEPAFLDISDIVLPEGDEQGLLSMAFHPDFRHNGIFYVVYTLSNDDGLIVRYQVSADNPNLADPSSAKTIFTVSRPTDHHNGGLVLIGPDNHLYAGFGDGGWELETLDSAQDRSNALGSIIRLDISDPLSETGYTIPADNPFPNEAGVLPEIWATGLRNPWRFTFDSATGDLYIADVGASAREEVNYQPAGQGAGANYGWRWWEGTQRFEAPGDGPLPNVRFTPPAWEYTHLALGGCSIIGGVVYRGQALPDLQGKYLFGDFCSGFVWALEGASGTQPNAERILILQNFRLSSFAQDRNGEVYLLNIVSGEVYRLVQE